MENQQVKKGLDMKQLTLDVEGLSDDQIALVRGLIVKLKQAKVKEVSLQELRDFLWKGVNQNNVLPQEEADLMAQELIGQVRNQ